MGSVMETTNSVEGQLPYHEMREPWFPLFDYAIIEHNYRAVDFKGGEITYEDVEGAEMPTERVYKNPRWIVKEKDHKNRVYDTTFVIMYCEGGYYVNMSMENYNHIQEFCLDNKEELLLYVDNGMLKGHCKHPGNMEKAKAVLEPIWNNPDIWLFRNPATTTIAPSLPLSKVPSESAKTPAFATRVPSLPLPRVPSESMLDVVEDQPHTATSFSQVLDEQHVFTN